MNVMPWMRRVLRTSALILAVGLATAPASAFAQEMDHSKMVMQAPPAKKPETKKPAARKAAPKTAAKKPAADPHAGHRMAAPVSKPGTVKKPAADPHAGHAMPKPTEKPATAPKPVRKKAAAKPASRPAATAPEKPASKVPSEVDHAAMGHEMPIPATQAEPVDHSAMGHDMGAMPSEGVQPMDHAAMEGMTRAPTEPITPIPELTDADRAAAAPPPGGHTVHDNSIQNFFLLDRLEGWNADEGTGVEWEAVSWIGTDLNRLWLRSEGERIDGTTESADIEVLYGRSVATWWDVVAGVRHDFGEGPSQTFAAIGVMGLAPYKYEVEATAYIGQSGQTAARLEAEYDTLFTNRLILQWQVEAELYGKDDPRRGIGSGLSTIEAGLRLRYEFTRKFAPYIGVVREQAFGSTADYRRSQFDDVNDTRIVAGLRIWF